MLAVTVTARRIEKLSAVRCQFKSSEPEIGTVWAWPDASCGKVAASFKKPIQSGGFLPIFATASRRIDDEPGWECALLLLPRRNGCWKWIANQEAQGSPIGENVIKVGLVMQV